MTLRPAEAADGAFLRRVYASTREYELAAFPWAEEQKEAFLRQQFEAQDIHFRTHYPRAEFSVVVVNGTEVGRLYVSREHDEIRVMDIALLPEWRGQGIGRRLLDAVLAEAASTSRPVSLYVEVTNPARRLYSRMGFEQVEQGPVYNRLEWRSPV